MPKADRSVRLAAPANKAHIQILKYVPYLSFDDTDHATTPFSWPKYIGISLVFFHLHELSAAFHLQSFEICAYSKAVNNPIRCDIAARSINTWKI